MFTPILRARAALGRCLGCRKGTSSIEFVMVLGPMILFLFGIIGFGLITYAHNNMVNAAREATRRLSVAEDVVAGNGFTYTCSTADMAALAALVTPKTGAQQIVCDYLTNWGLTFNVTATECDPAELALDPNFREVTVNISTVATDVFMVDIFGWFTGNLVAEVTMRREAAC